jgi:Fe/S biogenesis protein NfuA
VADQPLLAITQVALERVRGFLAGQPDGRALSVRVTGAADGAYVHALSLDPIDRAGPGNAVQHDGDLTIVVVADSVEKLRGATIDWGDGPQGSGFLVVNPNKPPAPVALPTLPMSMSTSPGRPSAPPAPVGDLDSDLARQVTVVLDRDVNPSIAAHGGHAELAGIQDHTAYLRLGGGCQGCGMASVTLTQGIEVAITGAVPEISDVVDVTDHASGTNPYFEQAKK